jgi:hypothetical protein
VLRDAVKLAALAAESAQMREPLRDVFNEKLVLARIQRPKGSARVDLNPIAPARFAHDD